MGGTTGGLSDAALSVDRRLAPTGPPRHANPPPKRASSAHTSAALRAGRRLPVTGAPLQAGVAPRRPGIGTVRSYADLEPDLLGDIDAARRLIGRSSQAGPAPRPAVAAGGMS